MLTTTDTWLIHHLTGAFVTDIATASRSLLIDLEGQGWSPELLAIFGLQNERMPKILASDARAGTTRVFGNDIPVGGLIVDQQAALLAEHCFEPGRRQMHVRHRCLSARQFGRRGAALARRPRRLGRLGTSGVSASIASTARSIPPVPPSAGWRQLGFISDPADLDRIAAASSNGVICVPAFAGLAAPRWNPDARASFTGLGLASGVPEMVRALLEGIAMQVAELCTLVEQETGFSLRRLKVDGGPHAKYYADAGLGRHCPNRGRSFSIPARNTLGGCRPGQASGRSISQPRRCRDQLVPGVQLFSAMVDRPCGYIPGPLERVKESGRFFEKERRKKLCIPP